MQQLIDRRLSSLEWTLLGTFVGLNALDAFLSITLVQKGYLFREIMPQMRFFLTLYGPPDYSFLAFWLYKMSLALGCMLFFIFLAYRVPNMRRVIFRLPVILMSFVCAVNLIWVIYLV